MLLCILQHLFLSRAECPQVLRKFAYRLIYSIDTAEDVITSYLLATTIDHDIHAHTASRGSGRPPLAM